MHDTNETHVTQLRRGYPLLRPQLTEYYSHLFMGNGSQFASNSDSSARILFSTSPIRVKSETQKRNKIPFTPLVNLVDETPSPFVRIFTRPAITHIVVLDRA